MVEFKDIAFGQLHEPLVGCFFLYDSDAGKKISESFYFDCSRIDVSRTGFNVHLLTALSQLFPPFFLK